MHENKCAQLIAAVGNSCFWLSSENPLLICKKKFDFFYEAKESFNFFPHVILTL